MGQTIVVPVARGPNPFSRTELDRLLTALPAPTTAPPGKRIVVGVDSDQDGQTLYAGFRSTPHDGGLAWELETHARLDRTAGNSFGAGLVLDWP